MIQVYVRWRVSSLYGRLCCGMGKAILILALVGLVLI